VALCFICTSRGEVVLYWFQFDVMLKLMVFVFNTKRLLLDLGVGGLYITRLVMMLPQQSETITHSATAVTLYPRLTVSVPAECCFVSCIRQKCVNGS
jgi:hypothetical protein